MPKIPTRLEDLLPFSAFEKMVDVLQRPELTSKVRDALSKVGLKEVHPLEQVQEAWQQARSWLNTIVDDISTLSHADGGRLINASGQLFFASIDRVPMLSSVGLAQARAATSCTDSGAIWLRSGQVVQQTLGLKHYTWVDNPLAGLQTAARTLGTQGVVIARSDSIRLAGVGDIHAGLKTSGAKITEVGAANGATMSDWTEAIGQCTGQPLLVLISPNGLPTQQAQVQRKQLLEVASQHGTPVVELLADGCTSPTLHQRCGFPLVQQPEGPVKHCVIFPTHFLLGGARGALLLGDEHSIGLIHRSAEQLGMLLDSSALTANLLALQLTNIQEGLDQGIIGGLIANPENLRHRCQRLAIQLNGIGPVVHAQVVDHSVAIGPSPWHHYRLMGSAVQLEIHTPLQAEYERLRNGSSECPAIEVQRQADHLLVDLRFVSPEDDHQIVTCFRGSTE
jgi:hypothetical protein